MKTLFTILICLVAILSHGQTFMTSSGNWSDASKWTTGNIGNDISENVTISNQNTSATVKNNESFTIGNFNMDQNTTLTIEPNGSLTIGALGNLKSFTTGQNSKLYIKGNLTVYGTVTFPQNIEIEIDGNFKIIGNLVMNANVNMKIGSNGTLDITGNFTGTSNTNVNMSGGGLATIHGNISVPNGSNLNTGGHSSFQYGGTCGGGNTNFCNKATPNVALPITLSEFYCENTNYGAVLKWVTVSEINFDRFEIEKATSDLVFKKIGSVPGHGNTNLRHEYAFTDTEDQKERVYYRLRSVDFDGSYEYSNIVSFQSEAKTYFHMVNPSYDGQLVYKTNTEIRDILIVDLTGKVYDRSEKLQPGLYVVKVSAYDYHTSLKLLVK